MSTTEHCDFPWNLISLFKITLIVLKRDYIKSGFHFCPFICINTTKATTNHIGFVSLLCWNLHKEPSDWSFLCPFGHKIQAHNCHQAFPAVSTSLKFLRFSLCLEVPPCHLSEKLLSSLPGKTAKPWTERPNKVARHFSSGLLLALKFHLSPPRLSVNNHSLGVAPAGMTFQSMSWLTKPQVELGFNGFMQRNLMPSLTH